MVEPLDFSFAKPAAFSAFGAMDSSVPGVVTLWITDSRELTAKHFMRLHAP